MNILKEESPKVEFQPTTRKGNTLKDRAQVVVVGGGVVGCSVLYHLTNLVVPTLFFLRERNLLLVQPGTRSWRHAHLEWRSKRCCPSKVHDKALQGT